MDLYTNYFEQQINNFKNIYNNWQIREMTDIKIDHNSLNTFYIKYTNNI